jgi:hypothetical protein
MIKGSHNDKERVGITDKDKQILNKIGLVKFFWASRRMYIKLCHPCKILANQNPRRKSEDYCNRCQPIIKKEMGVFLR